MPEAAGRTSPDRYVVERTGTPDPPGTLYYVLDLVNDPSARVALARLGREYERLGKKDKEAVVWAALDNSNQAHQAMWANRNPKR